MDIDINTGKMIDTDTNSAHIEWHCSECGAKGTVDPANEVETAIVGVREQHKRISPDCINSLDFEGKRFQGKAL
jgi:hypothetical protein